MITEMWHGYGLAVVAEWLRRLTRNQFPSGSAGSNPADCGELFPFPHLWHSNCDKPLFIFHNCSIQAIALTFIKHLTFKPAHTPWTITVGVSWGIVGSVVECSPATRAARVRFPDDANFSPPTTFSIHIIQFCYAKQSWFVKFVKKICSTLPTNPEFGNRGKDTNIKESDYVNYNVIGSC